MMREGEFEFDFSSAQKADKLDDKHKALPQGMQLVDFVVDEGHQLVLIEIKDPSCKAKGGPAAASAIERQRAEFVRRINNDELIAHELTPKARDSYCLLHLMKLDTKPMLYVVFLGAEELQLDYAALVSMQERLAMRLRKEMELAWARPYMAGCLVVTEKTWATAFPAYPMARVP